MLAIIVVLVIIIAYIYYLKKSIYGFYTGDPAFLSKSGLGDLIIFLHPDGNGYVVASDDKKNILDESNITFSISFNIYYFKLYVNESTILPNVLDIKLDPMRGKLILSHDGEIYADLTKNNTVTNTMI